MLKEFKTFIAQGNVLDLAVGVLIGAAFGKVVTAFMDDIINPVLGIAIGGVDFSALKIVLKAADPATEAAEVAIRYGGFLNVVIQFLITMWVIFLIVKAANKAKLSNSQAPKE
ncbi:large conductance mechanosensitive channel protein MscL [Runella sp. CRIBMP]|uniref:Large-conductance mechanosensitive channel n=1 Tax=Runella salmonicolor TaxID=2950278 RepID=A0ABT1FX42_9BACT|nr:MULTISPECIES: large conductance mechanosensitive channel protein MscL [Runella]MCP1386045.1 large conductance mechanosensitive channel protein MscL [Runella salmonicolor]NBB18102.1 large conductance mechanosensitive channel protein MscL [Runella sp. CRIBMP]